MRVYYNFYNINASIYIYIHIYMYIYLYLYRQIHLCQPDVRQEK